MTWRARVAHPSVPHEPGGICARQQSAAAAYLLQDFLTSAYLLTSKDQFLTRAQFAQLCGFMGDAAVHVDLPVRRFPPPLRIMLCLSSQLCMGDAAVHIDLPVCHHTILCRPCTGACSDKRTGQGERCRQSTNEKRYNVYNVF
jgi:hypothetical protein